MVLIVLSICCYPGGTVLEPSVAGYSFMRNFLSDLGMTVSYGRERNMLGSLLFVAALISLLGATVPLLTEIWRICAAPRSARYLARAAIVVTLGSCLLFVGVALTPENRVMDLHVLFTRSAFRVAPVATLLLTAATLCSGQRARVVTVLAAFSAALLAYVGVLDFGPEVLSPDGLVVQVVAQKSIAATAVVSMLAVGIDLDRANGRRRQPPMAADHG